MGNLAIKKRVFKGADIRRICSKIIGKPIHAHSWANWHKWTDSILKDGSTENYWINGDRAIILIAIALLRKDFPRKELWVDEVRGKEPEASLILAEYLKYFDDQYVIGREVQTFLELKGKPRSWNTIRRRIPNFSYSQAYRGELLLALVS